jgi:hypothetical protein
MQPLMLMNYSKDRIHQLFLIKGEKRVRIQQ